MIDSSYQPPNKRRTAFTICCDVLHGAALLSPVGKTVITVADTVADTPDRESHDRLPVHSALYAGMVRRAESILPESPAAHLGPRAWARREIISERRMASRMLAKHGRRSDDVLE